MDKKPKAINHNTTLQIRISLELRQQLNDICSAKNLNTSDVIRQLITKWIEEQLDNNISKKRHTDI